MMNSLQRPVLRTLLLNCQKCGSVLPDELVGQLCACLLECKASPDAVSRFVRRTMPGEDARELGRTCFGERWADTFYGINETWQSQATEIEPALLKHHGGAESKSERASDRKVDQRVKASGCVPSSSASASNEELKKARSDLAKSEKERKILEKELDGQKSWAEDLQRQIDERDAQLKKDEQDILSLDLMVKDLAAQLNEAKQNTVLTEARMNKVQDELNECSALLPANWRELYMRLAIEGEDPLQRRRIFRAYGAFLTLLDKEEKCFRPLFKMLDAEISSAYGDDADQLRLKRERVQEVLNARGTRYFVRWDLLGETYDSTAHRSSSMTGTRIVRVRTAQVLSSNGSVVDPAGVDTE